MNHGKYITMVHFRASSRESFEDLSSAMKIAFVEILPLI